MTTNTNTLVWRATTTTEHYNWIKKISDALTAIGFVKHTDTGQIDLSGSTVALPATPSTTYQESGYEIRKLVASGKPTIYARVGYGAARAGSDPTPANNNHPVLRMQFASGTDGTGNLNALSSSAMLSSLGFYQSGEAPQASPRPFYFASDGQNYLTMVIDPSLAGSISKTNAFPAWAMAIERTIDPDTGVYDADGMVGVNTIAAMTQPAGGAAPNFSRGIAAHWSIDFVSSLYLGGLLIPQQSSTLIGSSSGIPGVTPLFPITIMIPKIKGPMLSAAAYLYADIADGTSFVATAYGAARTFIAAGYYGSGSPFAILPGTNYRLALRYE